MKKFNHFEELWEACENYHKTDPFAATNTAIDELLMKVKFYKSLSEKSSNESKDALKPSKTALLGEILFALTKISGSEDVNVFAGLYSVLEKNSKT